MAGWLRGREQSRQEPLGPCADSWRRIMILNPSAHDGCNRPMGADSTRGRALSFDYTFLENYSIQGQRIIARWT